MPIDSDFSPSIESIKSASTMRAIAECWRVVRSNSMSILLRGVRSHINMIMALITGADVSGEAVCSDSRRYRTVIEATKRIALGIRNKMFPPTVYISSCESRRCHGISGILSQITLPSTSRSGRKSTKFLPTFTLHL